MMIAEAELIKLLKPSIYKYAGKWRLLSYINYSRLFNHFILHNNIGNCITKLFALGCALFSNLFGLNSLLVDHIELRTRISSFLKLDNV